MLKLGKRSLLSFHLLKSIKVVAVFAFISQFSGFACLLEAERSANCNYTMFAALDHRFWLLVSDRSSGAGNRCCRAIIKSHR
jgi:hypothetical protein